jgi:hypothetical protein
MNVFSGLKRTRQPLLSTLLINSIVGLHPHCIEGGPGRLPTPIYFPQWRRDSLKASKSKSKSFIALALASVAAIRQPKKVKLAAGRAA